jgi:LysM repeat protein
MMKKFFCILFLVPFFAVAQKVVTHKVGPKESLSSIGRLYNINGRELANYNKIDYEKGLAVGQILKIPVKSDADIPKTAGGKETVTAPVKEKPVKEIPAVKNTPPENIKGTPIYHTVAKKETLYHISTLYGKVPVESIKKWNNLTGDGVTEGTKLIVGYSKTKADDKTVKAAVKKPEEKIEESSTKAVEEKTVAVKESVKKEIPETVKNEPVVKAPDNNRATDFKGGVFKNLFDEQAKGKYITTETGSGGVFKSTSGWEDGKYYCLHNTAAAGTILKITNNATGRSVYAKVLDLITDIKQNNGLIIRLSNAAADALGVSDNKFDCTINYSK